MSKLFIVPTPIGNLEDMTYRAVKVLESANLILAEDTRTSAFLLKHYGIGTPMKSYHKFNEHKISAFIEELFARYETIALISDAGTPGISDPGYLIVRRCIDLGIATECLPGATAFVPALVNSGLPNDRFCFEGFLPVKKGRQTKLRALAENETTFVLYESPHRVLKTLTDLAAHLGKERRISVSREISKKFEETYRGTIETCFNHFKEKNIKGEFVFVVEGKNA